MPEFPYFWFVSAAFWFVLVQFARVTPAPGTWPDRPSDTEIATFRRRLTTSLCLPQVLLGLLQLAGGSRSPMFLVHPNWQNPYFVAGLAISVALWLVLLWWLWLHDGAAYLARFAPALNLPADAPKIRWGLTALIVISALTGIVQFFVVRRPAGGP